MSRGSTESDEAIVPVKRSPLLRSGSVRETKFRCRFTELPHYETLLKYIPCIWRKETGRTLRGGLYLSENHISFYCASKTAKETEQQRKLVIEIVAVAHITKERSLSIFPDSIGIETVTGDKYIFAQLFSRNTVYKSICDLCGISPVDSRRSSVDPSIFTGGGEAGFEDADEDDDIDSAANMLRESSKELHGSSTSSSLSSSSSSTPPDLKRALSVVREVANDDNNDGSVDMTNVDVQQSLQQSLSSGVVRSNSRRDQQHEYVVKHWEPVHDATGDDTAFQRHLITLLRLIVGLLILTALISVYQIYTRQVTGTRGSRASLGESLGGFRTATNAVIHVAEQAQTFLSAFLNTELRTGN